MTVDVSKLIGYAVLNLIAPEPAPEDVPYPLPEVVTCNDYLDLITSEHNQRPRYMQTVSLSVCPIVDLENLTLHLRGLFDVDTALGEQLDFVGQWIGVTRFINLNLSYWFTLDAPALGFDQAKWFRPYEDYISQFALTDEDYRILLKARIIANHWDGTLAGAYAAWEWLFSETGFQILLQNSFPRQEPNIHGNMHLIQAIIGPPLDLITMALFEGGYLGIKSAGVGNRYMVQNQPGWAGTSGVDIPLFGFDVDTGPPSSLAYPPSVIAGFDHGAWGIMLPHPGGFGGPPRPAKPILEDAPADGVLYGRQAESWQPVIRRSGDAMVGSLILAGNPVSPFEAAPRQYADLIDGGTY